MRVLGKQDQGNITNQLLAADTVNGSQLFRGGLNASPSHHRNFKEHVSAKVRSD